MHLRGAIACWIICKPHFMGRYCVAFMYAIHDHSGILPVCLRVCSICSCSLNNPPGSHTALLIAHIQVPRPSPSSILTHIAPVIPAWHGKSTGSSETPHVELRWPRALVCFFTEGAGKFELERHRKAGTGTPPRPTAARCTVHKPHQTRFCGPSQIYHK